MDKLGIIQEYVSRMESATSEALENELESIRPNKTLIRYFKAKIAAYEEISDFIEFVEGEEDEATKKAVTETKRYCFQEPDESK